MVYGIIEWLRGVSAKIAPYAAFECDLGQMLNVKVDGMRRYESDGSSASFIYIEEPTYCYYDIPIGNIQEQRLPITVYFCKFEPMENTGYRGDTPESAASPAMTRLQLRDQIEREMVRPFLAVLRSEEPGRGFPSMWNDIRITYPAPRFDANEVSVGLEMVIYTPWCLKDYEKPWKWLENEKD